MDKSLDKLRAMRTRWSKLLKTDMDHWKQCMRGVRKLRVQAQRGG